MFYTMHDPKQLTKLEHRYNQPITNNTYKIESNQIMKQLVYSAFYEFGGLNIWYPTIKDLIDKNI